MGIINRRLESLRDEDRLRTWLLDSLKYKERESEKQLAVLTTIAHHGAEQVALSGLDTEEDRHAMFDCFYREIEQLRHEYQALNQPCLIDEAEGEDLKSVLVWFGVTETAKQLCFDLDLDLDPEKDGKPLSF